MSYMGCDNLGQTPEQIAAGATATGAALAPWTGGISMAVAPFISPIVGMFKTGKTRARKTAAAEAAAQSILGQIRDVESLITRVNSCIRECFGGQTSTAGRANWVSCCEIAKSLGWPMANIGAYKGKPFPGCSPYDVEFASACASMQNFLRSKLSDLQAQLAKAKAQETAAPSVPSYPQTPSPAAAPSAPALPPPEEKVPTVEAGIGAGNVGMIALLAGGGLLLATMMGGQKRRRR